MNLIEEIEKIPSLTNKEARELAKRYQAGDINARQELIERNLQKIILYAQKYAGKTDETMEDLVMYGSIRLIRAIERFNLKKGDCNISYYINQALTRAFVQYAKEKGREPVTEIASYEQVLKTIDQRSEDEASKHDVRPIEDIAEADENIEALQQCVDHICASQTRGPIFSMRFGLEDGKTHTLDEIAETHNLNKYYVTQYIKQDTKKLQKLYYFKTDPNKKYL